MLHGYPDWWYEQNSSSDRGNSDSRNSSGRGLSSARNNNNSGGRPPPSSNRGRGRANTVRNAPPQNDNNDQIAQLISLLQEQRPNTSSKRLYGKTNLTDVIIDT